MGGGSSGGGGGGVGASAGQIRDALEGLPVTLGFAVAGQFRRMVNALESIDSAIAGGAPPGGGGGGSGGGGGGSGGGGWWWLGHADSCFYGRQYHRAYYASCEPEAR